MSRKWILTLCFAILAATLAGCAAKSERAPAAYSPIPSAVLPTPTEPPILLPTDTLQPILSPSANPEPTRYPEVPTPLPATQTPLPPISAGPVIAHLLPEQAITITLIRMLDAANGWAIGGQGQGSDHVLTTADGGQTWHDVTPPEPTPADGSLAALGYFADAGTAWVIYHSQDEMAIPVTAVVWRTQDGGQTWSEIYPVIAP